MAAAAAGGMNKGGSSLLSLGRWVGRPPRKRNIVAGRGQTGAFTHSVRLMILVCSPQVVHRWMQYINKLPFVCAPASIIAGRCHCRTRLEGEKSLQRSLQIVSLMWAADVNARRQHFHYTHMGQFVGVECGLTPNDFPIAWPP